MAWEGLGAYFWHNSIWHFFFYLATDLLKIQSSINLNSGTKSYNNIGFVIDLLIQLELLCHQAARPRMESHTSAFIMFNSHATLDCSREVTTLKFTSAYFFFNRESPRFKVYTKQHLNSCSDHKMADLTDWTSFWKNRGCNSFMWMILYSNTALKNLMTHPPDP